MTNSGLARVPMRTPLAGFIGIGIAVAGGNVNTISRNRVSRSQRYGIAIFPTARFIVFDPGTPEPGPPWRPRGNRVTRNLVTGGSRADLALARGSGKANCFSRNVAARSLPRGLQTPTCARVPAVGDHAVAADLTRPVRVMWEQTMRRPVPDYTSMPTPPAAAEHVGRRLAMAMRKNCLQAKRMKVSEVSRKCCKNSERVMCVHS